MKTVFAAAIALSLLSGTAAMAAPNNPGQGNNHQTQQHNQQAQKSKAIQQVKKPAVQQTRTQTQSRSQTVTKTKYTTTHAKGEYRYNGKTYKAVKAPAWHAPKGYEAQQHFRRGQNLPSNFRNRAYVVDYRAYNLNRPNAGYEWVRVNNNVYMVQANNGHIAQIIWSMFN